MEIIISLMKTGTILPERILDMDLILMLQPIRDWKKIRYTGIRKENF